MPQQIIKPNTKQIHFFAEPLLNLPPLNMVLIESGKFMMGSPDNEIDRRTSESPQHEVTIPSFFMSEYLVTQAQWAAVANKIPSVSRKLRSEPSGFKNRDVNPVERITWFEAVEFCDRLSAYTKRKYRLPSEAEWEYACRAGSEKAFHFGETISTDLANYDGTDDAGGNWSGAYGRGEKGIHRQETTPVNTFRPNANGLYDMHGNVWEWCLDHWHDNYEGAPIDGSAWLSTNEETTYVIRGGSWNDEPRNCRSATRNNYDPEYSDFFIGFRVVCEIPRTL
jgi:formylglycine-generating enzyme required for sulfatase activity